MEKEKVWGKLWQTERELLRDEKEKVSFANSEKVSTKRFEDSFDNSADVFKCQSSIQTNRKRGKKSTFYKFEHKFSYPKPQN